MVCLADTGLNSEPVIRNYEIQLAVAGDAGRIARMSRDLIETGLGWSWTQRRVMKSLRDRDTNVAIARESGHVVGFCVVKYRADEAHVLLFAVAQSHRRRGLGTALIRWVEQTALVAGIGIVYLEARLKNTGARAFYQALGFQEIKLEPRRYSGIETGVRLGKDLWVVA